VLAPVVGGDQVDLLARPALVAPAVGREPLVHALAVAVVVVEVAVHLLLRLRHETRTIAGVPVEVLLGGKVVVAPIVIGVAAA
jgi:hypothetical protein